MRATRDFLRDPLRYLVDLHRHGDVVRTAAGPFVFHTCYEPRSLRELWVDGAENSDKRGVIDELLPVLGRGLLSSEGELWREQRRALVPGLAPRALEPMLPQVESVVDTTLGSWSRGQVVDASQAMMHLALRVVGRTLFGVDLGERAAEVSQAVARVSDLAYQRSRALLRLPLGVPTPANLAYRRAIRSLQLLVEQICVEGGDRTPFLQRLRTLTGADAQALRDQVMTFLLAGHETTATTVSWALGHLARDQALQERARSAPAIQGAATDEVGPSAGMGLLDAIGSETLRLYPPGWMLMRRAKSPVETAGYAIPAGSFLVAPVYALHRLPEHWRDPERFDPSRFLEGPAPDPMLFAPFGLGPRRCIGEGFARLEMRVILARILGRFRLEAVEDLPAPRALTTLRPQHPIRLKLALTATASADPG